MFANALNPDALLAWEMNGQPLKKEHGYPARLLIPGIYGMKNVKWLTGISIVANDFKGFWQSQGWDDAAPYQTESRLDVPRSRDTITVGRCRWAAWRSLVIAGFSPLRFDRRGEDVADGPGKPGLSPNTWQLWRADIKSTSR